MYYFSLTCLFCFEWKCYSPKNVIVCICWGKDKHQYSIRVEHQVPWCTSCHQHGKWWSLHHNQTGAESSSYRLFTIKFHHARVNTKVWRTAKNNLNWMFFIWLIYIYIDIFWSLKVMVSSLFFTFSIINDNENLKEQSVSELKKEERKHLTLSAMLIGEMERFLCVEHCYSWSHTHTITNSPNPDLQYPYSLILSPLEVHLMSNAE